MPRPSSITACVCGRNPLPGTLIETLSETSNLAYTRKATLFLCPDLRHAVVAVTLGEEGHCRSPNVDCILVLKRVCRMHKENECAASECSLVCNDYLRLGYDRFVVDPGVRQAYTVRDSRDLYNTQWVSPPARWLLAAP